MDVMFSRGNPPPTSSERAMVFIDGTNLFYRLMADKLKVSYLVKVIEPYVSPRKLVRAYLYTVQQHLDEAKRLHGNGFFHGIRVVLGDGIVKKDGNIKEKGVDALLVADMVFHAASRNYEYALIVTADTDFVYVIKRVEDFGCKTGILSICCEAPSRLVEACDDYNRLDADELVKRHVATRTL